MMLIAGISLIIGAIFVRQIHEGVAAAKAA